MRSAFAVTLLGTFAHAAFSSSWGAAAGAELPASDQASNPSVSQGPTLTAESGKVYKSASHASWKVTESSDQQALTTMMWTEVSVDGTAGIGTDIVDLLTCYETLSNELKCRIQSHSIVDGAYVSTLTGYSWSPKVAFPTADSNARIGQWSEFACASETCPYKIADQAEYHQPGAENTGKRQTITKVTDLVNAGFYGASRMAAYFSATTPIVGEELEAYLVQFKQGLGVPVARQDLLVSSSGTIVSGAGAIEIFFAAEKAATDADEEEDSALSFGAAVGAMAVAVSALAF